RPGAQAAPGAPDAAQARRPRRGPPRRPVLLRPPRGPRPLVLAVAGPRADAPGGRHLHLPGDGPPRAKKNELKPWQVERFCIPEKDRARFVAQMEEVLDQYAQPEQEGVPLICMDEA